MKWSQDAFTSHQFAGSCSGKKIIWHQHHYMVPADYINVFSAARSAPSRYDVESLYHRCFKDYSKLGYDRSIWPGTVAGDPHVTDVVALCYRPTGEILYKLSFDKQWQLLPVARSSFIKKTSQPDATNSALSRSPTPLPLYKSSIPIKTAKFVHLQELKTVLHRDYHNFYDSLEHICNKPDACPHIIAWLKICEGGYAIAFIITAVMVMYRRCWHVILTVRMDTADYLLLVVFFNPCCCFYNYCSGSFYLLTTHRSYKVLICMTTTCSEIHYYEDMQ